MPVGTAGTVVAGSRPTWPWSGRWWPWSHRGARRVSGHGRGCSCPGRRAVVDDVAVVDEVAVVRDVVDVDDVLVDVGCLHG